LPRSAGAGITAYFDARSEALYAALTTVRAYYAVEGIHEFRVEIKRLRALYKLVEYVALSFSAKQNASTLAVLFRTAGELRDIDIYQAITLGWLKRLDLREYFNYLKQNELRMRESFAKVSKSFSKATLSKSRAPIRSAVAAIATERIRKRVDKRITKLTVKLMKLVRRKRRSNDDLHLVRKASKALRYTLDIRQECFGMTREGGAASARLKIAYGYLGEWHDMMLTMESVKSFIKRKSRRNVADPAAYATFEAHLHDRAESLLRAYDRGRRPLHQALDRLSASLRR
jgi:CHAD domain-containing protein